MRACLFAPGRSASSSTFSTQSAETGQRRILRVCPQSLQMTGPEIRTGDIGRHRLGWQCTHSRGRNGSEHCVHPSEHLRQVGTMAPGCASARTAVDLESRTGRVRPSANVEAFSAAHIYELGEGNGVGVVFDVSDGYQLPLHRGAGGVTRPLLNR
jgi:hypothetical protein